MYNFSEISINQQYQIWSRLLTQMPLVMSLPVPQKQPQPLTLPLRMEPENFSPLAKQMVPKPCHSPLLNSPSYLTQFLWLKSRMSGAEQLPSMLQTTPQPSYRLFAQEPVYMTLPYLLYSTPLPSNVEESFSQPSQQKPFSRVTFLQLLSSTFRPFYFSQELEIDCVVLYILSRVLLTLQDRVSSCCFELLYSVWLLRQAENSVTSFSCWGSQAYLLMLLVFCTRGMTGGSTGDKSGTVEVLRCWLGLLLDRLSSSISLKMDSYFLLFILSRQSCVLGVTELYLEGRQPFSKNVRVPNDFFLPSWLESGLVLSTFLAVSLQPSICPVLWQFTFYLLFSCLLAILNYLLLVLDFTRFFKIQTVQLEGMPSILLPYSWAVELLPISCVLLVAEAIEVSDA